MKRAFYLVALMLLLLLPVVGWTADWYCAATGTNGDGTEANPWVDFSNIDWSKIQPGDTLHLYRGQAYNDQGLTIGTGGNSSAWITIIGDAGAGTGKPIINPGTTTRYALRIDYDYIEVRNLQLVPGWNGTSGAGIKISSSCTGKVRIIGVDVVGTNDKETAGILIGVCDPLLLIDHCTVSGTSWGINIADGIAGAGTISNCVLYDFYIGETENYDGIRARYADHTGLVIENCDVSGFQGDGIDLFGGSGITVKGCVVHDPSTGSVQGGIKLGGTGSTNNVVTRCIVYNLGSSYPGINFNTGSFSTVSYCLVYGCGNGISTSGDNNKVYNNTLIGSDHGIYVLANYTGIEIKNNILSGINGDLYLNDGDDVEGGYNCFVNNSSVMGSGTYTYTGDTTDLYATNPLFTSTYHLSPNSPCINAGTFISGFHETALDIDRQPILGTPDIGCDERKGLWWDGRRWHMQRMY